MSSSDPSPPTDEEVARARRSVTARVEHLHRRRRRRQAAAGVIAAAAAIVAAIVAVAAVDPASRASSVHVVAPSPSQPPPTTTTAAPTTVATTSTTPAPTATVAPPLTASTTIVGPTTTTSSPATTTATTSTTLALDAGVFTGAFRFHVTTMDISSAGQGTATWEAGPAASNRGIFHLTSVAGTTATGVVDSSTAPSDWAPGQRFTLTLQPDDMLVVAPSGPFAPMCGAQANDESNAGDAPPGVNCGA